MKYFLLLITVLISAIVAWNLLRVPPDSSPYYRGFIAGNVMLTGLVILMIVVIIKKFRKERPGD